MKAKGESKCESGDHFRHKSSSKAQENVRKMTKALEKALIKWYNMSNKSAYRTSDLFFLITWMHTSIIFNTPKESLKCHEEQRASLSFC